MPLRRMCAVGALLELLKSDHAAIREVALGLSLLELASKTFGIVALWFVETGGASISLVIPGWLRSAASCAFSVRARGPVVQDVRHAEAQGALGLGELHWGTLLES